MVTLETVAKLAGVSRPTVSLVLNERGDSLGIAAETQQRVLAAAQELGYRRNELARAALRGKNRRLGFLAPDNQEHALRLLAGALEEAERHGYLIEWHRMPESDPSGDVIRRCVENRLPGVMVVRVKDQETYDAFRRELAVHSIPLAVMDLSIPHAWGTRVLTDDEEGVRSGVEHLIGLGHSRIVFISGDGKARSSVARERGYLETMKAHGLEPRMEWGDWKPEPAQRIMAALAAEKVAPTAVFCANDVMALAAMRTARSCGYPCPDGMSVVGYSNLLRTALADPALTTVEQSFEEMGRRMVLALLEQLDGGKNTFDQPQEIRVPVQLIVRASTAAPRSGP